MKNAKLTNREREIVDAEYEKHRYDNICPHTTNPLQLKSLCQRCRQLSILNISIYQLPPKLGGSWAVRAGGEISNSCKSRSDAEEWGLSKVLLIEDKRGNRYRNIGAYIDLDT